jgi:hypothetical protein
MSYAPIEVPKAFIVAQVAALPDFRQQRALKIRSTWSVNTNEESLAFTGENFQLYRCSTLTSAQIFS